MRLLLDTHILLWWLSDDAALPDTAREAIASSDNEVFVSAATVWEIAIKKAAGRLEAPDDLLEALGASDFQPLSIVPAHALVAGGLPMHHLDPFDRMLIAQAQSESLTLITVDRRFFEYEAEILAVS